jgi:Subtilase family
MMSEGQRDFRLMVSAEPFDPLGRPAFGASLAPGSPVGVIVQFRAPLTSPDAARLKAAYGGLALDRYVPNLAYAERLPGAVVDALREDFLVRACVPIDPAVKVAPWMEPPAAGPLAVTAILFDDADTGAVESALAAIGARDVEVLDDRPIGGAPHVRLSLDNPATLPQVADIADVLWIEPTPSAVSRNVKAAQTIQSGRIGPGSSPIWDKGLDGKGQIVGIMDDGTIDLGHCFFADDAPNRDRPGHRKVVKIFNGAGVKPTEHFMFVAGIVAGDDRGNPGKHQDRGGAYAAQLVLRNRQVRAGISMYGALDSAREFGATIHNNSWGDEPEGPGPRSVAMFYNTTCHEVDKFSWDHEDNLVVAAGADEGDNTPPGIAKNTLCVACAKAPPDHMTRGSGISGPTFPDKRRKPEIMAVGCGISSALIHAGECATGPPTSLESCSTSWASANAAAAAALVRQYFTEGWYPSGKQNPAHEFTPSGALIKAVLLNSTVDMTGLPGNPSHAEGWGLIQLDQTLYFKNGPRRLAVKDVRRADGMESGEVRTRVLHVGGGTEKLKITLVWTDPPPSQNAYRSPSTNVIEMTVQDPNGVMYRANDIDVDTGLSKPNGTGPLDRVNNVQMVIVNNPPAGPWLVRTRATVNAGGQQGFALVASGSLLQIVFLP